MPVGDEWLLSGGQYRLPPSARVQACQIAAELAQGSPKLVFRNPKKLEQAWEAQWRERQRFISFFSSDQVVIPGRELSDRMKAFRRFDAYEVRDTDGLSDMERIKRSYGVEPPLPEWNFPDDLVEAETVGVIYDEVEGLNFFPDFGLVEEAFVRPELVKDDAHREVVLGYLRSTGIIPLRCSAWPSGTVSGQLGFSRWCWMTLTLRGTGMAKRCSDATKRSTSNGSRGPASLP